MKSLEIFCFHTKPPWFSSMPIGAGEHEQSRRTREARAQRQKVAWRRVLAYAHGHQATLVISRTRYAPGATSGACRTHSPLARRK